MPPTKFRKSGFYSPTGEVRLIKEGGISTVFETEKGQELRAAKRLGNSGGYFASPVFGDGKIYIAGENGHILVLRNGSDYEEMANNDLEESIVATPAIAGGGLFVRTRQHLKCFAEPKSR